MTPTPQIGKGLLRSKTFWGVVLALLAPKLGYSEEVQAMLTDEIVAFIQIAMEAFGGGLVLFGRLKANTPIDGLIKKP